MKTQILTFCATGILLALVAGCSTATGGAREIKLSATEMKYEPAVIQVRAGEKIKFAITNKGKADHEFESEQVKFDELQIPAGKTRSVAVTIPDQPGEYEFFCDVPGHKDAGMTGKIVVSK